MNSANSFDLLISSLHGNHYLVSRSKQQVLYLHPVLRRLILLKSSGNLINWLGQLPEDKSSAVEISSGLTVSRAEIDYYHHFLLFLEENGYFSGIEKIEMKTEPFNGEGIKKILANSPQVIFECTEHCNLSCKYCAYGDLYAESGERKNRDIEPLVAQKALDDLVRMWESPLNRKYFKKIAVSFYGGEPLLNFPFIENMVRYAGSIKLTWNQFFFSMTTNGVLLDQYMDFLVENEFMLLISLDGDEGNNGHRCFPDGSPSFPFVYRNARKLQEKYPVFFKKNVNFASVLHDRNSTKQINHFFKKEFGKQPLKMEVTSMGIKPERRKDFEQLFRKAYSDYSPAEMRAEASRKSTVLQTPFTDSFFRFFWKYSGCVFKNYDGLVSKGKAPWSVCPGTCEPFGRKIFITSAGGILPCERVLHKYQLGFADRDGLHLDFEQIARTYNQYYRKLERQCNDCGAGDACTVCIFNQDIDKDLCRCTDRIDQETFKKNITQILSALEESRIYYPAVMKKYHTRAR